ncbi:S9 family peptidase [Candidatus Poribacteria bacterium]|nr:S9 family peptidase [Candidatus Poribacteria bacterium]
MKPAEFLNALLALPSMSQPIVSWDGRWVAWTWFGAGPAADVYVAPADGSAPPTRLTDTLDNTFLVSWTPDSRAVLVEQDKNGNERTQLFRVDLAQPLVMVPLTEPEPKYFIRGGNLHPNSRWLVYGANFNVETGQEIEPTWIYRHDLETGERRPLARPAKGGYISPELNSVGTYILYPRMDLHPAGQQIWLVDIEGREDREILNFGADVKTFASWFPDGQRVLVMAETKTHSRLGVWELTSGALKWLLDDPARNLEYAFVPHRSERIVVIEIKQARVHSSLLDAETGEETRLPDVPGNLVPLAPVGNDEWVGQYYSSRQPADVVRFSMVNIRTEKFFSLSRVWERTALTQDDFTPAEDFRWKAADNLEIQGWLYRPKQSTKGTIVYVHGGPTGHSEDDIDTQVQFFARQGFNVLDPNYRGSTGFSLAFREAIKADGWGGREQDDIRAGIEALIAVGIAEPGKIGITGTSYGGYSSWCAITRFPPEIVAASAPICGMTDLVVDYETTRPDLRPYSEEMMGGSPDQVPKRYYERSPIHFVGNIKGRLLIVQGLQDPNVTPENVRTVTSALQQVGVEYQLLTFEDEGHGISKPKNQKTLYLRLLKFFASAFSA